MPQFNATDAIFFGFRLVKRDPLLLLALAGLATLASLLGTQMIWRELVELAAAAEAIDPNASPEDTLAAMGQAYGRYLGAPPVLGYLALLILTSVVIQGAILRSLVRDERGGWVMGMQLGGDELRIFVVGLVVAILVFLLYCAALFAVGLVAGLFSLLHPALGTLAFLVAALAAVLAVLLVGTRLSAAAPASVGERKFIVFGSWRLTRGRMWGLLGAYVVLAFLWVMGTMIVLIPSALLAPQATAVLQGMTPPNALDDPGAAFRSPGYILVTALNALLNVVLIAGWSGVGAYAYRMLGGGVGYPHAHPPDDGATAAA